MIKERKLSNGKELIIRPPVVEDASSLIEHMKVVDTETRYLGREAGEFSFTLKQEEAFIKGIQSNKMMCFYLAIVDGQVIGNVSVGIVRNNLRFLHRASIGITVQKKLWRQGIGKDLLHCAIEWCKTNGIEQLELEVISSNTRAIELYKSYGFEIYGTLKHALKYGDKTYADEYKMVLMLGDL